MKKHIKFIFRACLALCMVICLGLSVACQPADNGDNGDNGNTFTITILNEDGTASVGHLLQYCSDGANAQCYPKQTDSNGKVKVDVSTDEWKNSKTIHIQVFDIDDGYKVYDKNGTVLDYDDINESYDIYVDHHTVNSVTLTIKADANVDAENIEVGYQYDVRGLSANTPKYYATVVNSNEAIFEADVYGGEFELSVTSGTTTSVVETLNAENTYVNLSLIESMRGGASLEFTLTPKNADSNHITFTVCPVYEIGSDGIVINAPTQPDVYKVYLVLDGSAELVFDSPWDEPLTEDQISGFPITLTIGSSIVETWTTLADIAPISVLDRGYVPVTFEFGDPDNANLFLRVKNANASSDNDSIVLGQEINVSLENMFDDSFMLTFIPEESGTYLITITGSETFTVQYTNNSTGYQSDTYFYSDSIDGVIKIKLESYVEYTIRFGTDNFDSPDSYTAVVTKSTDPDDDDDDDNGNGNGGSEETHPSINLGELTSVTVPMFGEVTYTFLPAETGTYVITVYSNNAMLAYNGNKIDPTEETTEQVYEIVISEANTAITLTFSSVAFDIDTFNVIITKK